MAPQLLPDGVNTARFHARGTPGEEAFDEAPGEEAFDEAPGEESLAEWVRRSNIDDVLAAVEAGHVSAAAVLAAEEGPGGRARRGIIDALRGRASGPADDV